MYSVVIVMIRSIQLPSIVILLLLFSHHVLVLIAFTIISNNNKIHVSTNRCCGIKNINNDNVIRQIITTQWCSTDMIQSKFVRRNICCTGLLASSLYDNNNNESIDVQQQSDDGYTKKKQKRNKYETFSKVTSINDPLETLMEQSRIMNEKIIIDEEILKKKKSQQYQEIQQPMLSLLPQMQFPDTTTIDPYDPQTFGYIALGTIIGAHGVRGWLRVKGSTVFDNSIISLNDLFMIPGIRHIKLPTKRAPRPIQINQGKQHQSQQNLYLIQLQNVYDRDVANSYKGSMLYIREEQQQEILLEHQQQQQKNIEITVDESEEYSVSDLVGIDVYMFDFDETLLSNINNDDQDETNNDDEDEENDEDDDDLNDEDYVDDDDDVDEDYDDFDEDYDDDNDVDMILDDDDDIAASTTINKKLFVGKVHGIVFGDEICAVPGISVGYDYLEILLPRGINGTFSLLYDEYVLIPFIPNIVPIVDIVSDNKEIYINPPNGLLNLTYIKQQQKVRIKAFLPSSTYTASSTSSNT